MFQLKKIGIYNSRFFLRNVQTQVSQSDTIWPCFRNIKSVTNKIAIHDSTGKYSYGDIFFNAKILSDKISSKLKRRTPERVMFLCNHDVKYITTLWSIWMAGHIAVPLSPLHPQNLLLYYCNDAKPKMMISVPEFEDISKSISDTTCTELLLLEEMLINNCKLDDKDLDSKEFVSSYERNDALILYTTGTTGNPKGVVLNHDNLSFQVNTLLKAWKWSSDDVLLHSLPLNHIHGIVNALLCPLSVHAEIILLPKFEPNTVWANLIGNHAEVHKNVNIYMGVPTMYSKLIDEYDKLFNKDQKMKEYIKKHLKKKIRLMVCGSAPLPQTIFEKWLMLSGHELLERYGMTEIGMCLSNSYESKRKPSYVGNPLPGVSIRISEKNLDENLTTLIEANNVNGEISVNFDQGSKKNIAGLLLVKSEGVFKEYFGRPIATEKEFTKDGYFITGDICSYDINECAFKILGRENMDIIKSGGYKLSALEIETQLLDHHDILECSVIGSPDEKWGEKVVALVVLKKNRQLSLEDLRSWLLGKLPKYSMPSVLKIIDEIPRNAMGKVNKKQISKLYMGQSHANTH